MSNNSRNKLKMADDSSDDDIPISQLTKKESESTVMSVLSAMKTDPELNTKIPPETADLISGFASKHFAAENEINNASTMAKDYSKDALLLMSKKYPTKFLGLDFKDCEYMNDLTLHPLVANMGTSDIPQEWGTKCWEIRKWRQLSQEAQDKFLLNLSERPSIDEMAKQLGSLQLGSLKNLDRGKKKKEEKTDDTKSLEERVLSGDKRAMEELKQKMHEEGAQAQAGKKVKAKKSASNTNIQKEEDMFICAYCGKEGFDAIANTCNKCKSVK